MFLNALSALLFWLFNVPQDLFSLEPTALVPRLFLPDLSRSFPDERLESFKMAMEWEDLTDSDVFARLVLMAPRARHVEEVLASELDRFTPILHKFDLVGDRASFPQLDERLATYGPVFRKLHKHKSLFRVFFGDSKSHQAIVDLTYKSIIFVIHFARLRRPDIRGLMRDLCHDLMASASDKYLHLRAFMDFTAMFEVLPPVEFYMLLSKHRKFRGLDDEGYDTFIRRSDFGASEALLAVAKQVPLEIHPEYKSLCLSTRVAYYCDMLVLSHENMAEKIDDLNGKIQTLRTRFGQHAFELSTTRDLSLGFELDYEIPDSDSVKESKKTNIAVLKVFQFAASWGSVTTSWPAVPRILNATTKEDQLEELRFVESLRAVKFTNACIDLCEAFAGVPKCENLFDHFESVPVDMIKVINSSQRNAGAVAYTFLEIAEHGKTRLKTFMDSRKREDVQGDCCVCIKDYAGSAIELCPPSGEFQGHHLCEECVSKVAGSKAAFRCPVCRSVLVL